MQLPARIGKYELEEFLGGGMSRVYRARDTVLGRRVAVKLLTEVGGADPEVRARFLAEARIASKLTQLPAEHQLAVGAFLQDELERQYGFEVFVDAEQRDTAGQLPQKLQRQIERCDVFVCLLAGNTLESAWVKREIELAHTARKPMIPVFQESFTFPEQGAAPEYVQELLLFDGVRLLDRQNVYVNAAIKSVSETPRGRPLSRRAGR